ncbi:MAG: hypothetical protein ACXVPQ_03850 [Bacteroidia bacterium]
MKARPHHLIQAAPKGMALNNTIVMCCLLTLLIMAVLLRGQLPIYDEDLSLSLHRLLAEKIAPAVIVLMVSGLLISLFINRRKSGLKKNGLQLKAWIYSPAHTDYLFNLIRGLNSAREKMKNEPELCEMTSGVCEHLIRTSRRQRVSLRKEAAVLKTYVELQNKRNKAPLVFFDMERKPAAYTVGAHLLFPIVHAACDCAGLTHSGVSIRLKTEKQSLMLLINFSGADQTFYDHANLRHAQRRLQLQYPQKHRLSVLNDAGESRWILHIDL